MDDSMRNLVVTENYIVQPVESIPISVIDYENIGITHLLHSGSSITTGQIIRVAPSAVQAQTQSNELHPLEMDIQRDLELKQKNFLRDQRSVIVCDNILEETVKRPNSVVEIEEKPVDVGSGSAYGSGEVMQLQQVLMNENNSVIKSNYLPKYDQISLTQLFPTNKEIVVQGKSFVLPPDNQPLMNSEWKINKNQCHESDSGLQHNNDSHKSPNTVEIPLTVQNYFEAHTKNVGQEKAKKLSHKSDTEDEEDEDNIEPVCDYEPDPEATKPVGVENSNKPNKCYMCFKSFRQKKNMYAHIRKIHSIQPKIEGGILCPLCKMHALRQEHLRNHFETLHNVRIEKEEKLFNTMEEFLSWKEFIERETLSLYVSKSSAKLLANNQQKTYYKCHRSGNYVSEKKEDRKKKLKVQGSNKIGATCPAAMEVTENVHGVNVIFWKTHVGHENDAAHLVLSKEDKARIRESISSGIPWDTVLENIKKETEKSSNASRLMMVSKQDLRNIKKLHDMKTCDLFHNHSTRKVSLGRKPMKERMLRKASQSLLIEKADLLLNLLETTEVIPEFRPKVCLMIDNLISTIKRRAVKNTYKSEKIHERKRKKNIDIQIWSKSVNMDSKAGNENDRETNTITESIVESAIKKHTQREINSTVDGGTESMIVTRKRGRPKKNNGNTSHKMRKNIQLSSKCNG